MREDRGAKVPEGMGCGEGCPSPPWEESGEGAIPRIFLMLDLKMSTSIAFWALFSAVQLPVVHAKTLLLG